VNAITKGGDGIVSIDQSKCSGCETCLTACPYGVPRFMNEYKIADKCDFCKHRVHTGRNPICVESCPARAIIFGELDEPFSRLGLKVKSEGAKQIYPEGGTEPSVYYL
jgi:Fe-S-cluster-containing dehydrogenase component